MTKILRKLIFEETN